MSNARLYLRYVGICLESQMQYKASFLMLAVANFLMSFVEFAGTAVLFARFGSLRGWELAEVAMFYGVVHAAFAIAEAAGRGFDVFHLHVRKGTFDRMLLRPRSTVLQVLGQEFRLLRVGRLLQGLCVALWGAANVDLTWTPSGALLVVAAIAGGVLIFMGLLVLQATLSFWSVESLEIANTLTYGGVETAQFPLSIYSRPLRDFFTFVVPLGCVSYFPVAHLLGRTVSNSSMPWLPYLTPAVGAGFFGCALAAWHIGVRHYHSTGS